jgi:hypothetical protein
MGIVLGALGGVFIGWFAAAAAQEKQAEGKGDSTREDSLRKGVE